MATVHEGRIGEQHEAYRKGIVLGLTMAEIAILIIFVLLLLLVFNQLQRAHLIGQLGGRDPVQLTTRAEAFEQIASGVEELPEDTTRDFQKLVRVISEAVRRPGSSRRISEATSALQDIRRARKEIESVASAAKPGSADSLGRLVEEQSYAIGNLQGQIKALKAQLDSAGGKGGELPSCWADQGGHIDYVYEVVLNSNGIRMRQIEYGERLNERMLITSWVADPNEPLSEASFVERTQPWYDYSQRRDCRFFVDVYDETGPQEKLRYKALLKTVEGHFYKRLNSGAAPF